MKIERNEIKSSAHSKYRCQYHIVFAPKYRRKEVYGTIKKDIGEICLRVTSPSRQKNTAARERLPEIVMQCYVSVPL